MTTSRPSPSPLYRHIQRHPQAPPHPLLAEPLNAFVHFLHDGPSTVRAGFGAFLKELDAEEDAKTAWQKTLGRIPKLEMARAFYDYTNGYEWSGVERQRRRAEHGRTHPC